MLPLILCDGKDTAIRERPEGIVCPELLIKLAEFKASGHTVLMATDPGYDSYVFDIINQDKNFKLNSTDIFTDSVKIPAAKFSKMDKEYYQILSEQYNQPINTMILFDDSQYNERGILRAGGLYCYPFDMDNLLDHERLNVVYQQALRACTL